MAGQEGVGLAFGQNDRVLAAGTPGLAELDLVELLLGRVPVAPRGRDRANLRASKYIGRKEKYPPRKDQDHQDDDDQYQTTEADKSHQPTVAPTLLGCQSDYFLICSADHLAGLDKLALILYMLSRLRFSGARGPGYRRRTYGDRSIPSLRFGSRSLP